MLLRERPRTPVGLLPAPSPLPSLTAALSRRSAIFGAVAVSGVLASAEECASIPVQVEQVSADTRLVAMAAPAAASPDAWLIELGQDMAAADRGVDAIVAANPQGYDEDPAWERLVARFRSLFREMERMPAITAAGLHAKAQALQIPWVAENAKYTARLSASLADDVRHLCAGAVES